MGIMETVLNDWLRERRIKKHRKEIDVILRKQSGAARTRVTSEDNLNHVHTGYHQTAETQMPYSVSSNVCGLKRAVDPEKSMENYDKSGLLDQDVADHLTKKELDLAVAAITRVCQTEKKIGGLEVTCSHDGQNVQICVRDGEFTVGKWRYQLQPDAENGQPIHLYHLNYQYNRVPGPNYHFQQQAEDLYTPEDVAVYILRHDKKKAFNDRKKRQDDQLGQPDNLIGE